MESTSKDKLIVDMKTVMSDVEGLLKAATTATGESATALRDKASEKLKVASAKLSDMQDAAVVKGKRAARHTDDYVHANPWKAVGVAAAAGVVIGLLLNRR